MNDIKIDYNTANIVLKVNIGGKKTEIFLPPASQNEIKKNALVLGEYSNCIVNIATNVLIIDWDVYLEKCIKSVVNSELGFSSRDDIYDKKVAEYKDNIFALLDRSIVGGYYFVATDNGIEATSLNELSDDKKDIIRSNLLFFIVALRYVIPNFTEAEAETFLKKMNITTTSLSATEYKNTITTQSKKKETSKK